MKKSLLFILIFNNALTYGAMNFFEEENILEKAVKSGNITEVKNLLEHDEEAKKIFASKKQGLANMAVEYGHIDIAHILWNKGASKEQTLEYLAEDSGNKKKLILFLDKANLEGISLEGLKFFIFEVVTKSDDDAVGAEILESFFKHITPELKTNLLETKDQEEFTPFLRAIWREKPYIALVLLKEGSNPHVENVRKVEPLLYFIRAFNKYNEWPESKKNAYKDLFSAWLLRDDFDRGKKLKYYVQDQKVEDAFTQFVHSFGVEKKELFDAIKNEDIQRLEKIIKALGFHKYILNIISDDDATPLIKAFKENNPEIALMLLQNGIDPKIQNIRGAYPFIYFIRTLKGAATWPVEKELMYANLFNLLFKKDPLPIENLEKIAAGEGVPDDFKVIHAIALRQQTPASSSDIAPGSVDQETGYENFVQHRIASQEEQEKENEQRIHLFGELLNAIDKRDMHKIEEISQSYPVSILVPQIKEKMIIAARNGDTAMVELLRNVDMYIGHVSIDVIHTKTTREQDLSLTKESVAIDENSLLQTRQALEDILKAAVIAGQADVVAYLLAQSDIGIEFIRGKKGTALIEEAAQMINPKNKEQYVPIIELLFKAGAPLPESDRFIKNVKTHKELHEWYAQKNAWNVKNLRKLYK